MKQFDNVQRHEFANDVSKYRSEKSLRTVSRNWFLLKSSDQPFISANQCDVQAQSAAKFQINDTLDQLSIRKKELSRAHYVNIHSTLNLLNEWPQGRVRQKMPTTCCL